MKKILFFMLFITFSSSISAKEITVDYVQGITANRYSPVQSYSGQLGFIQDGNRVIYCIEPFKWIGKSYQVNNEYFKQYSDYTNDYIKMVANYADELVQKKDVNYYMAAQYLIWSNITDGTFTFTTNQGPFGTTLLLTKEKNEIDSFVKKFLKKPDFGTLDIKGNMYDIIELQDYNNVLSTFNIINESKNKVWSKENKLFIKILSDEVGKIRFEKSYGDGEAIYYHNEQKQDLADLKSKVVNSFSINVSSKESYYNDYRIEFIDKETNNLIDSNISFQINNEDKSCTNGIYIAKANEGIYDINVISAPGDYVVPNISSFEIKSGFENNYVHKVYLEKKKYDIKLDSVDRELPKETINESNYCVLNSFKELPNTIDYIKVIKIVLVIIILVEIKRHAKEIFKN